MIFYLQTASYSVFDHLVANFWCFKLYYMTIYTALRLFQSLQQKNDSFEGSSVNPDLRRHFHQARAVRTFIFYVLGYILWNQSRECKDDSYVLLLSI